MTKPGIMQMPADFKYREVCLRGKPGHAWNEPFALKHPAMDCERRAKIFSPFDALKGFSEMLAVHTDPAVFRTVTLAKRTVRAEDIPEM